MAPVRVTYFIHSLHQGGAERQLSELIAGLDRTRFAPSLITCIDDDQLHYAMDDVPTRCLKSRFPSVPALRELALHTQELGTDVLHSFMGLHNAAARLVAQKAGIKRVVTSVRCTQLPLVHVLGDRFTHQKGDALIVNSVGIRQELVRRAGIPAERIEVIENGVDLARFVPLSPEARMREHNMWSLRGMRTIVVPGRVSRQKNQLGLIKAVADLRAAGQWPSDVRVVLAGRGSPPWYEAKVRAYKHALMVGPEVEFAGVVQQIERLVAAADAVLMPSHFEGLPNAVLEGMACGVMPIVTPAANVDRLVTDGVHGLVCEGPQPAQLVAALKRFFALAPEQREAMGRRAREHAQTRFSVDRMVERTTAVYDRLLGTATPPSPPTQRKAG